MRIDGSTWAGRAYGTNTGNLYLEYSEDSGRNRGVLRLLDDRHGLLVYDIDVRFEEGRFLLNGMPAQTENSDAGEMIAEGRISASGNLEGQWETKGGYGGTFVLSPHSMSRSNAEVQPPERSAQLYTKREALGPISIDKSGLVFLARTLASEIGGDQSIVVVEGDTRQAMLMRDFELKDFSIPRAVSAKIQVQRPERDGLSRYLAIEFGQDGNFIAAESTDESWAVGVVHRIKRVLKSYELPSVLSASRFGVGVNQIIFLGMLAYLPSIPSLGRRVVYVFGVIAIIWSLHYLHTKLVPNASIILAPNRVAAIARVGGKFWSWLIGIVGVSLTAFFTVQFGSILEYLADFLSIE